MTARKTAKAGPTTDEDSTEQVTGGEIVVYEAPDGDARVEVIAGHETVWLSEAKMADLFDRDRSAIGRHIRNVFDEGERQGVLEVIQRYSRSWRLLRAYDEGELSAEPENPVTPFATLDIASARTAIRDLRNQMLEEGQDPGLFGQERGEALESILLSIEQTFGGQPL